MPWSRLTIRPRTIAALLLATSTATASSQIERAEYGARRDSLAARLGSGVVLAFGGRTPVADFGPFYQLPSFRYLTGYDYADATLVMLVRGGRATSTLFANRSSARRAIYYGEEPDSLVIASELGLASRAVGDLDRVVDSLATVGFPFWTLRDFAAADFAGADSLTRGGQFVRALESRHANLTVRDAHPILAQLRARKTEAELALIRKAAEISAHAHSEVMRRAEAGMHEYDLQAIIEYEFRRGGAERPAYGSIVGSGPKSSELHYMKDRRAIQAGEVVVIDAAAEYHGYAADITRTIPLNGRFSPEQRALYQVVLDAQAAAERNAGPGGSIGTATDSSFDVRARGLAALGLVESTTATFDPPWPVNCDRNPRSCQQTTLWAIHGISHGLGLEVHDPIQSSFGDGTLKQGDAFVLEPGLYISPRFLDLLPDTPRNRAFIAKVRPMVARYANIGVRIEDDYVITDKGLERISAGVPREIAEIEALMRKAMVP